MALKLRIGIDPFGDARELAETHACLSLHAPQGLGHRRILSDPAVVDTVMRFLIGDHRQTVATRMVCRR
jgi:hypothetical protein